MFYPERRLKRHGLKIVKTIVMKKNKLLSRLAFLLFVFYQSSLAHHSSQDSADQMELKAILKKVGDYCQKLEKGAYYFVCQEEISEKVDYSRDFWLLNPKFHFKYLYDYQLIKKENVTKESRILLERNGLKVYEEGAALETKTFRHQHVLLRTVDLFSAFGDTFNDYNMIGEETLFGEEAIVIEAFPKTSYEHKFLYGVEPSYLLGKIWVKKDDYSILKIVWNPKIIKDFKNIEELAERYKAEPRITIISEYKFEKNGIRFPSRLFVEEAYIDQGGKKFIRSETEIIYRDYKFFTVETEVKY